MKPRKANKQLKAILVFTCLIVSLLFALFISVNFIVNPIVYWLASTEGARVFVGCILSWLGVSLIFNLYYKRYKRIKKFEKFNALKVPYPRTFKGRK